MEDHRINRKKRHPLVNIVAITIVAIICNAETWEEITYFGEEKQDFFSKFLDLKSFIFERESWTHLRAIVRIDSQRYIKKAAENKQETRYYITSLANVEKIAKAIRSHWGIENKQETEKLAPNKQFCEMGFTPTSPN
jgi:predicted transposase YbfD/YdcC